MNERIEYLLGHWIEKQASEEERLELMQLLGESKNVEEFKEALDQLWFTRPFNDQMQEKNAEKIFQSITGAKMISMPARGRWIKWIAAASIILIVGLATLLIVGVPANNRSKAPMATTHDVQAPINTRAVITLANGQKVYLDSAGNGTIAQESNVQVVKNADGEITYAMSPAGGGGLNESSNNRRPGVVYNTLFNPRGSQVISLTLSDGTRVWLNSESSLRYPASFALATNREVEITGEAYFEVKHNAKQPFKVHLPNGSIVEDIGTSFNIHAYDDEADIKASLVEGSVKVYAMSPAGGGGLRNTPNYKRPGVVNDVILRPGQQAVLNQDNPGITRIEVQTNVDMEQVLAWKNGLFFFADADVETVMNQVARWYDVQIVYESRPTKIFRGSIPRDMSAAKVFKALEETGSVHFKIEGKKVTVMK